MSKLILKPKAIFLRKNGFSINEIKNKLKISKSTASLWCKGIVLTEQQQESLKRKLSISSYKGRMVGVQINKNKKLNSIKEAEEFAKNVINNLTGTQKEFLFMAVALYWSEGSKSESTSGFVFINSDPEMILLMKLFLINIMKISESDIVCAIQINKIHEKRIDKVLNFWKNLLNLDSSQLRNPYYINTKSKKIYSNYDSYYGVCRLIVRKSMNLKYKMIALINVSKNIFLPM